MKNRNLFLCLVLVLVISVVLAGCSSTSSESSGRNDTGNAGSQAWNDPSTPQDQTWNDPENYESQAWSDSENYDDQDWRDTENPSTEAADLDESDHAGMYRHEIDGIVFYTEHDVAQWITILDNGRHVFDLGRMAIDLFGEDAMGGNGNIVFYGGRYGGFGNTDLNGGSSNYPGRSYHPYFGSTVDTVYDMEYDAENENNYPYFFSDDVNKRQSTTYEMLEIALYACEMWANDETYNYAFENFEGSQRLMVVHR